MPKAKIEELKAEIERLKAELRNAQAWNIQISRQYVEASNARDNKLNEAIREISQLEEQIAKLRKQKK
jgi:uncharacterized small protein (DUF1192 family)